MEAVTLLAFLPGCSSMRGTTSPCLPGTQSASRNWWRRAQNSSLAMPWMKPPSSQLLLMPRNKVKQAFQAWLISWGQSPCAHLTQRFVQGNLLDAKAVEAFGTGLDCITIEIEGVSVPGLEALERKGVRVVPKPAHIALIQDKGLQKQFFQKHNIATAPFALQMANGDRSALGYPVVQKLRRGGYDGKGVAVLKDASSQHFQGKDAHCVLEQKIDIEKELSVVVCRRSQYDTKCYEPTECVFDPRGNVVQLIVSPASITPEQKATCNALAKSVVDAMDYIGILAVEMFLEKGTGKIMVNELAPRAHNSGHHTIEQCATSQFGQLLRVVLDLP